MMRSAIVSLLLISIAFFSPVRPCVAPLTPHSSIRGSIASARPSPDVKKTLGEPAGVTEQRSENLYMRGVNFLLTGGHILNTIS